MNNRVLYGKTLAGTSLKEFDKTSLYKITPIPLSSLRSKHVLHYKVNEDSPTLGDVVYKCETCNKYISIQDFNSYLYVIGQYVVLFLSEDKQGPLIKPDAPRPKLYRQLFGIGDILYDDGTLKKTLRITDPLTNEVLCEFTDDNIHNIAGGLIIHWDKVPHGYGYGYGPADTHWFANNSAAKKSLGFTGKRKKKKESTISGSSHRNITLTL